MYLRKGSSGITRKDKKDDRPVQGLHFEGLTFMHADRDIWQADDVGIQHDWEMEDKDNALILLGGPKLQSP